MSQGQKGQWMLDSAGLIVYTERFGWFAYPFGKHAAMGPFADLEAAKASLRGVRSSGR